MSVTEKLMTKKSMAGKLLSVAITCLALSSAAGADVVRLSEPAASGADYEDFGAPLDAVRGEPLSLTELIADEQRYLALRCACAPG